jgi:hypothetical protein
MVLMQRCRRRWVFIALRIWVVGGQEAMATVKLAQLGWEATQEWTKQTSCCFCLLCKVSTKTIVYFLTCKWLKVQRGPKVTSLVARSSRGRYAQHLHDVRGLHDAHRSRNICVTYGCVPVIGQSGWSCRWKLYTKVGPVQINAWSHCTVWMVPVLPKQSSW